MPPNRPITTMTVFHGRLSAHAQPARVQKVVDTAMSENYTILAQSADELRTVDNSPSVSMWPYLLNSAQTQRLNEISIYALAGTSAEASRLLYMNSTALLMWREMGKTIAVVGEAHRPPRTATLSFGMPFAD